jgi:small subunit ribosomal protein S8
LDGNVLKNGKRDEKEKVARKMLQDTLADALSSIKSAEKDGKGECITKASNLIKSILSIMQEFHYIGAYELIDDGRGGKIKVELKGKIIDCNVIKPRSSIGATEFEKWEKRFLPASDFGLLILSTPKGVMDHKKAKQMNMGGRLLAYVY